VLLSGSYAVCRLPADAPIPAWAFAGDFSSVTRTGEELSIVCLESAVPAEVRCVRGWRCLRVAGTLDFALVGILSSLTVPLAEANVSVVAVSTFDTDYILVREEDRERALAALRRSGVEI
jgi:hypothetical protein